MAAHVTARAATHKAGDVWGWCRGNFRFECGADRPVLFSQSGKAAAPHSATLASLRPLDNDADRTAVIRYGLDVLLWEFVQDQQSAVVQPTKVHCLFTFAPKGSATQQRLVTEVRAMLDEDEPRECTYRARVVKLNASIMPTVR